MNLHRRVPAFALALISLVVGIVTVAFYANGYRVVAAVLAIVAMVGAGYSRAQRSRSRTGHRAE